MAPVAMAPQPVQMAPVAMAPQPVQMAPVAMAPQQQVGQSPLAALALTTVLTNPGLLSRLLGGFGEMLAELKQPRMRMGQAPVPQMQIMQAPVASAPVGMAPAGYPAYPAYPAYPEYDYQPCRHPHGKVCRLCDPRHRQGGPDDGYGDPGYGPGGYRQAPPPQQPYYPGPSPTPQGVPRKGWFGHGN
jgi:hypothetical protein